MVGSESRKGNSIAVLSRRQNSCENRKPPRLLTTLSYSVRSAGAGTHTVSSWFPAKDKVKDIEIKRQPTCEERGSLYLWVPLLSIPLVQGLTISLQEESPEDVTHPSISHIYPSFILHKHPTATLPMAWSHPGVYSIYKLILLRRMRKQELGVVQCIVSESRRGQFEEEVIPHPNLCRPDGLMTLAIVLHSYLKS